MLIMRVQLPGPSGESKHVAVNHLRIEENVILDMKLVLEPDFVQAP